MISEWAIALAVAVVGFVIVRSLNQISAELLELRAFCERYFAARALWERQRKAELAQSTDAGARDESRPPADPELIEAVERFRSRFASDSQPESKP
jgi:hypothetical protein